MCLRCLLRCLLLSVTFVTAAHAERPVYRALDANGGVIYSDRAAGAGATPVRRLGPANPSYYEYESARMRAARDALDYERMQVERSEPPPVVVYQPERTHSSSGTTDEIRLLPPGYDLPPPAPRVRPRSALRGFSP